MTDMSGLLRTGSLASYGEVSVTTCALVACSSRSGNCTCWPAACSIKASLDELSTRMGTQAECNAEQLVIAVSLLRHSEIHSLQLYSIRWF